MVWCSTEITFLGHKISDGKWSFEKFIKKKMQSIGHIKDIKKLESVIGVLSYARRCIVGIERILGPLREKLGEWKAGAFSNESIQEVQYLAETAFHDALDNMKWLTLPGAEADSYIFQLESDWSNSHIGYMLFVQRNGEERLVDIGSKKVKVATSSYLGELDAIVWACKCTKAFRGSIPLTIRTVSHAVYDKTKSGSFYDSDIRAFRKWGWLVTNEPGFKLQFLAGSQNKGADHLNRPNGECFNITLRWLRQGSIPSSPNYSGPQNPRTTVYVAKLLKVLVEVNQININEDNEDEMTEEERINELRQLAWEEHCTEHWGPYKVRHALHRKGLAVPWDIIKQMCSQCEICAAFKPLAIRRSFRQPSFSLVPGRTLFIDIVGPLPEEGGLEYIHCIVDSASRMMDAVAISSVDTGEAMCALMLLRTLD